MRPRRRAIVLSLVLAFAGLLGRRQQQGRQQEPHELLPSSIRRLSSEPSRNQTCIAKKFPCADLGKDCVRPSSLFFLKLRGCGGKTIGEGLFNHILDRDQLVVSEGWSLAHTPTMERLMATRSSGGLVMAALRNPIDRAISRYWFEGRWPLFLKSPDTEPLPFHAWLLRDHCGAKHHGARLWDCTENYYVKTLAGFTGEALCHSPHADDGTMQTPLGVPSDPRCHGGVGQRELDKAKSVLETLVHVVILSEDLSDPRQIAYLGDTLCFAHHEGQTPVVEGTSGQRRAVPSLHSRRPAGGHTRKRPTDWEPTEREMRTLQENNQL
eukprot:CAMPEP_0118966308 /NCGR_PEP_ID=MMETSP1173-20130426/3789_1 /TAXON_ID=1034831 /ORGANISM="Rhizochromulina marina cf, Strain CCMP1243" /LENGTH=323 /DNA_ID=CAMNT_0006915065 /DNA_START=35 /DNA_END=1002 /DNA_ORIENTATION=+